MKLDFRFSKLTNNRKTPLSTWIKLKMTCVPAMRYWYFIRPSNKNVWIPLARRVSHFLQTHIYHSWSAGIVDKPNCVKCKDDDIICICTLDLMRFNVNRVHFYGPRKTQRKLIFRQLINTSVGVLLKKSNRQTMTILLSLRLLI